MKTKDLYAVIVGVSLLLVGIQPTLAVIQIPGDDSYYDIIDGVCVLNQDVVGTIEITSPEITLDGGGHTVSGTGTTEERGVFLSYMDNVTIRNLTVKDFDGKGSSGIFIQCCSGVSVTGNNISNNYWGMYLYSCGSNTVTDNNVSGNAGGIWVNADSNYNAVEGNIVSNNTGNGIYIRNSCHNTVTGNTVSSNGFNFRIRSYDNETTTDNEVYNNNFEKGLTGQQALVDVVGSGYIADNVFNRSLSDGGNYWSDWTGPDDEEPFGIVDESYDFTGGQDELPWTVQDGWLSTTRAIIDIMVLVGTVADLNAQQGIINSLDAKLGSALNALDDVNENNDVAALNSLQAFINAVEAQSGNKITEEQADVLVEEAQRIINLLIP